jgi:hypothetical protein
MLNMGASPAVAYLNALLANNIRQAIRTILRAIMPYQIKFLFRQTQLVCSGRFVWFFRKS